jgi:8-oxo-dGTP pyrophosphatase MutT (NUDIX family)
VFDERQFARWVREGEREEGDPIPAATVVLVRDSEGGVEALMLRKNSKLAFGGMWVFPGGRIDDADRAGAGDILSAARRAAVREAAEEADLVVDEPTLAWISHWLPPGLAPKRYATWFFVARAPEGAVTIDGAEIHDSAWMRPAEAMERRDAGEIELAPPTWMTLHHLSGFATVDELLADAAVREPRAYCTQIARCAEGMAAVWDGDASYGSADPDVPGPRHRLWMLESGWRLEQTPGDAAQT